MFTRSMDPEEKVSIECRQNHGPIRSKRTLELGMTPSMLRSAVRNHRLRRLSTGVLAAAGAPETRMFKISYGIQLAGAPKDGERITSAACFLTAAEMLGIWFEKDPQATIHVLSTRFVPNRAGYRFHRTARLPDEEITQVEGLPCTDAVRTFLDVCCHAPRIAPWVYHQGLRKRLLDAVLVQERIDSESRRGRGGLVVARQICEMTDPSIRRTRSAREVEVFGWIKDAGPDLPARNVRMPSSFGWDWEIDLYYPEDRLGVEVSPYDIHGGPTTFHKDRLKEADLQLQGIRLVTVSDETDPGLFIHQLRVLLGREINPPQGA